MKCILRFGLAPGVAATLLLASLSACETTKRGFPEMSTPSTDTEEMRRKREIVSKQIAAVSEGKIRYIMPREQLSAAFTREFGDGTAIDKTVIRKVQETPKDKAVYYIVGMGLRNGMYRAMALPLQTSSDNSLYLPSNSARYIITGVGCTFCFFNFEKNEIVGTTCEENTGGSRCDLRVESNNTFFVRK